MTTYHQLRHGLNVPKNAHSRAHELVSSICVELHLSEGAAPEWVHLLPLGPEIQGRDGRLWQMADPEAFVRESLSELPAPLDYMHASERVHPDGTGDEAPAAGWIVELNVVRDGDSMRAPGIWGRIDWTPRGSRAVAEREYRFISPAFLHRKTDGALIRLTSAGLVHKPNLVLTALNARGEEENVMNEDQRKALCRELGLPEDASHDAVMNRVRKLDASDKALNARGEVVPKADLESALNRASAAEGKLKEYAEKAFNARRDAVLDEAQKSGKFPPSSRDFYAGLCTSQEALERLEAEMKARPALVSTAPERAAETTTSINSAQSDDWVFVS